MAATTRYGFGVSLVIGDTVDETLPQIIKIMEIIFGISKNIMLPIADKVLEDSMRFLPKKKL